MRGSQLLRVAPASRRQAVERVIASLQQLPDDGALYNGSQLTSPSSPIICDPSETLNIGLAISGGVDSMALAVLCGHLQSVASSKAKLRFRAFVVDHDVRPTSKDEANSVAKILTTRDIPTSILKIEWPSGLDPKSSPKFESLARTHRFQALGRACRDHNIESLFLAHHEDDQAETLLMRLATGHKKRGLLGMNVSAPIPECHGIYGVDRSGRARRTASESKPKNGPLESEYGGVMVHRPLLGFTKARLREICLKNDMPWFEDHTNADPRLTMRNAIRHIYANHRLPVALQKPSLLAMLSRLQKQRDEAAMRKKELWSRKIQTQHFDSRFSVVSLQVKPLTAAELSETEAIPMLLELLRSVIQRISSTENIELSSLLPALLNLFPELQAQAGRHDIVNGVATSGVGSFNKAGVRFIRQKTQPAADDARTWLIMPEKPYRGRAPSLCILPSSILPLQRQSSDPDSWNLWDGRYWVNICNQTPQVLRLQHLCNVQPSSREIAKHNRTLLRQVKQSIGEELSAHSAEVHHTLPTLTVEEDGKCTGRIIAFPTLAITDAAYRYKVSYVARHKLVEGYFE